MLCAIAKLDEAATQKLVVAQRAALGDAAALRPLHGHITLATYTGEDEASFIRSCKDLIRGCSAFSVDYEKLAVLEESSIIAALPRKDGPLEALHRRIAEEHREALDLWTGSERWIPHTTLFYGPGADLHGLCRSMSGAFAPFSARICGIEFSRVLDAGYALVDRIALPD